MARALKRGCDSSLNHHIDFENGISVTVLRIANGYWLDFRVGLTISENSGLHFFLTKWAGRYLFGFAALHDADRTIESRARGGVLDSDRSRKMRWIAR